MIKWILDMVRHWVGHYLLSDEEELERRRDEELARKQKEILDEQRTSEDTARDLDRGEF